MKIKIAKRNFVENEMKLRHVQNKIADLDRRKFTKLREQHPEFSDLSDADLTAYIEVYDEHLGLGFMPHSRSMIVGGCFILFCNWLFFNAGSSGTITQDKETNIPQLTIMNTILSACGSVVIIALIGVFADNVGSSQNATLKFDVITLVGAIMAGCVSATACCNNVDPSSAVLIGFIGAIIYRFTV